MFLAKIKDSFMFGGNPNKSHWYLVYTRNNKVLYLKQTTHLYKPDIKRMEQVKYGVLRKAKLTSFDVPLYQFSNSSGVRLTYSCQLLLVLK